MGAYINRRGGTLPPACPLPRSHPSIVRGGRRGAAKCVSTKPAYRRAACAGPWRRSTHSRRPPCPSRSGSRSTPRRTSPTAAPRPPTPATRRWHCAACRRPSRRGCCPRRTGRAGHLGGADDKRFRAAPDALRDTCLGRCIGARCRHCVLERLAPARWRGGLRIDRRRQLLALDRRQCRLRLLPQRGGARRIGLPGERDVARRLRQRPGHRRHRRRIGRRLWGNRADPVQRRDSSPQSRPQCTGARRRLDDRND